MPKVLIKGTILKRKNGNDCGIILHLFLNEKPVESINLINNTNSIRITYVINNEYFSKNINDILKEFEIIY